MLHKRSLPRTLQNYAKKLQTKTKATQQHTGFAVKSLEKFKT